MTQSDLEFLRSRHGIALGEIETLKEEVKRLKGIIFCDEEEIGELSARVDIELEKNDMLCQQLACAQSMVQALQNDIKRLTEQKDGE